MLSLRKLRKHCLGCKSRDIPFYEEHSLTLWSAEPWKGSGFTVWGLELTDGEWSFRDSGSGFRVDNSIPPISACVLLGPRLTSMRLWCSLR